jgi:hypothetical protein
MNTRQLAVIAVIGPVLWVAIVGILTELEWDFLRDLGWDPLEATDVPYPSSTALGPYGWLQILNFLMLGITELALAIGLWRILRPRPRVGLAFLGLLGVASVLSAFPTDGGMEIRTWHGAIHAASFVLMVISSLGAQIALAIAFWNRPGWSAMGRYSLVAVLLAIGLAVAASVVAPLGSLFSTLTILTIVVWVELLALRLFLESRPIPE